MVGFAFVLLRQDVEPFLLFVTHYLPPLRRLLVELRHEELFARKPLLMFIFTGLHEECVGCVLSPAWVWSEILINDHIFSEEKIN